MTLKHQGDDRNRAGTRPRFAPDTPPEGAPSSSIKVDRPGRRTRAARLTVMSGIAELERDLIRKRCQAGIERAKAKGTKFGRTSVLDAGKRRKIAERYVAGETMAELARDYGCGEATIWRALQGRPFSASQASAA